MVNQRGYNTVTDNLDRLCRYFKCSLAQLAEYVQDEDSRSGNRGAVDAKRRQLNVAALSALRSSVQGCEQQAPIGRKANGRST